ncbi:MAG: stage II sporulation protein M [Armatimonadota bacterium]
MSSGMQAASAAELGASQPAAWVIFPPGKLAHAGRLFLAGTLMVFVLGTIAGAAMPTFSVNLFAKLRAIYLAPVGLAAKYVSVFAALILGNALAAIIASSLGAAGTALLARLHERDESAPRDYGLLGRASYQIARSWCWLGGLVAPEVREAPSFGARSAAAISVLAPRASGLLAGGVLGLHLAGALVQQWIPGVVGAVAGLFPHALFEFPAIALSVAVGLALAEEISLHASAGPRALGGRALSLLASPSLRRTLGFVFALVLIGAALEVRALP